MTTKLAGEHADDKATKAQNTVCSLFDLSNVLPTVGQKSQKQKSHKWNHSASKAPSEHCLFIVWFVKCASCCLLEETKIEAPISKWGGCWPAGNKKLVNKKYNYGNMTTSSMSGEGTGVHSSSRLVRFYVHQFLVRRDRVWNFFFYSFY